MAPNSLKIFRLVFWGCLVLFLFSCKSNDDDTLSNTKIAVESMSINGIFVGYNQTVNNIALTPNPQIKIQLVQEVDPDCFSKESLKLSGGLDYVYSFTDNKTILCDVTTPVKELTAYKVDIPEGENSSGGKVVVGYMAGFVTMLDSIDKYPRITDDELLDKVQQQTFKYFWDFAHPVSGLAREGTSHDPNWVTMGGSGFGIAAIIVGIERGFISRSDGLARMQTIVDFLTNQAVTYHGAFPHWMDGRNGATVSFGGQDNGADLVETAFLLEGLIIARQYFNGSGAEETLRNKITALYDAVDWDFFRQNSSNVLYWHWSPDYGFAMNMPVRGWNEALMVYLLAAGSTTSSIPLDVYTHGWARNGDMRNGKSFYGITLPLGSDYGGPLFFAHYSFIGLDPRGLSDQYADYWQQNVNHTGINRAYCINNPKKYAGYSADCWGLTASNIPTGYTASSPTNDIGTIAPTAALSSMPYTPDESMQALRFFYYKIGDRTWSDSKYGFYDAFDLNKNWVSNAYLAIDQGPIICMIENYRSGLLWNLFMTAPEVQQGLAKLGFVISGH